MVPMVHTNILYSVDWGICDSKSQFGTKSQIRDFQNGVWKSEIEGFGTQNGVFWDVPEMEIVPKYILDSSATIPAQFSYIKQLFQRKIVENRRTSFMYVP